MDELKRQIAREIPHLRRYALVLRRDPDSADDLVQDCLERALRKRRLWGQRGTLRSWLFRILYTLHINSVRDRRLEREAVHVPVNEQMLVQQPRQDSHVEYRSVAEALDTLPEQQRQAILLVSLDDLSYDEAADVLGVPIGTLRSRLSRARESLRRASTVGVGRRLLRRVK